MFWLGIEHVLNGTFGEEQFFDVGNPPVLSNAVGCGEQVRPVDEGAAAHVHVVVLLLLQNGHLPRIFA